MKGFSRHSNCWTALEQTSNPHVVPDYHGSSSVTPVLIVSACDTDEVSEVPAASLAGLSFEHLCYVALEQVSVALVLQVVPATSGHWNRLCACAVFATNSVCVLACWTVVGLSASAAA